MSTADPLEKKIVGEIQEKFEEAKKNTLSIANKLSNIKEGDGLDGLIEQAREELVFEQKLEIKHVEYTKTFLESYSLVVKKEKRNNMSNESSVEGKDRITNAANNLQEHIDRIHESMIVVQGKVMDIRAKRRIEVIDLKENQRETGETLCPRGRMPPGSCGPSKKGHWQRGPQRSGEGGS